jgi:hypothetical protein
MASARRDGSCAASVQGRALGWWRAGGAKRALREELTAVEGGRWGVSAGDIEHGSNSELLLRRARQVPTWPSRIGLCRGRAGRRTPHRLPPPRGLRKHGQERASEPRRLLVLLIVVLVNEDATQISFLGLASRCQSGSRSCSRRSQECCHGTDPWRANPSDPADIRQRRR